MKRHRTILTLMLLGACACSAKDAFVPHDPPGAEVPVAPSRGAPPAASAGDGEGATAIEHVDRMRAATTERLQQAARWFDGFFGDEDYEDELATTRARLEAAVEISEGLHLGFEPKIKAQVALPRLEGTATALVIESLSGSDVDEGIGEDDDDIPISTGPDDEELSGISAALRWVPVEREPLNLSFDAGVRLIIPPEPFVRARSRQRFQLDPALSLTTRETLFWILGGDGLGIDASANLDRNIADGWLGRLGSRAKLSTESDGIEWSAGPQLFYRPLDRVAVMLRVTAAGRTEPAAVIRNWRVQLRYRQSVIRPWFFYGVEPEISWPKDEDRQFTPAVVLRVGVLLDPENTGLNAADLF